MYLYMYILYTVYLFIFTDDRDTFRYYTYLYIPSVIIYIYMQCNYRMALHSNISLLDAKKVDVGLSTVHSAEKGCLKRHRVFKEIGYNKSNLEKKAQAKEVSLYRKLFDSSFF